jgi:hypothetical protein
MSIIIGGSGGLYTILPRMTGRGCTAASGSVPPPLAAGIPKKAQPFGGGIVAIPSPKKR